MNQGNSEEREFLTQRRKGRKEISLDTRQRFAPLRLCVSVLLGMSTFRAKLGQVLENK
jgi:hypothetical protein